MSLAASRVPSAHRQGVSPESKFPGRHSGETDTDRSLDNQTLQQLYRIGAIQTKLNVSNPDDSEEQLADAVAEQMLQRKKADCECPACKRDAIFRKAASAGRRPGMPRAPGLGTGRPLSRSLQREFSRGLGTDLSSVRIHTDSASARSARALKAQAYTHRDDVVFDEGQFRPESTDGRRLLAHELVHVAQQRDRPGPSTIQRNGDGDDAPGEFDPCAVNVGDLTNAQLVDHLVRTRNFLAGKQYGEGDGYYDWANLDRRLARARQARIRQGHLWLGESNISSVPSELYSISAGTLNIHILPAPSSASEGDGGRIISRSQFEDFLAREGIDTVDIYEYFASQQDPDNLDPLALPYPVPEPQVPFPAFGNPLIVSNPFGLGMTGAGLQGVSPWLTQASPFDQRIRPYFSRTPNSPIEWRGHWPEQSYLGAQPGAIDLNEISPSFRVVDVNDPNRPYPYVSLTHSMPGQDGEMDWSWTREKFRKMTGDLEPANFANMVSDLNARTGSSFSVQDMQGQTMLAMPADILPAARLDLARQISVNRSGGWTNGIDSWLRHNPVTLANGQSASSYAEIAAARDLGATGGGISHARYRETMEMLGMDIATARTVGVPMLTGEMASSLAFREQFMDLPAPDMQRLALPETIEAHRRAGSTEGGFGAAQRTLSHEAGMRGAKFGAASGFIMTAGGMLFDPVHARWQDLALSAPMAGMEGYATGVVDQRLTVWANQRIMAYATQRAAASGSTALVSRVGGPLSRVPGGLAGGPISAGFTLASMGIDDAFLGGHYTGIDYTAKGSRAFVSGTIAGGGGALAAGITGAIAGSEFPLVGNAVGFLVGVGIYYLVDNSIGEDVESSVRQGMGEQGCVDAPADTGTTTTAPPVFDVCFLPGTKILRDDGSEMLIENMCPGMRVLSFDENTNALRAAEVVSLHRHFAADHLCIELSNGRTLGVTRAHRFFAGGDWRSADSLRVGDQCLCAGEGVAQKLLSATVTSIRTELRGSEVYNLSIAPYQTYVAERAIVHNVKP